MHAPRSSLEEARQQSPCVRNCCLDDSQVCVGCGRDLQEILTWRDASADERALVLERAQRRQRERNERYAAAATRTDQLA